MNKLIIFPTDTVYGIGCSIYDIYNIDKIYEIKKRDKSKPLACLCASLEQIESIAYVDELASKLINKYLPGGLTLVLKSKEKINELIGYETIGVRIPDCSIAIDILSEFGPMLTTSVNDSGMTPINEYEEIKEKYSTLVDEIYPPYNKSSNVSSTVIKLIDGKLELLREGNIKFVDILNA